MTFIYTRLWTQYDMDFESEAVDVLYYNDDTSELGVEWIGNNTVHVFSNVPLARVITALNSDSVGASVNDIKRTYGPGVAHVSEPQVVEKSAATVSYAPTQTKEFSLQTPAQPVNTVSLAPGAVTKEYSLQTPSSTNAGIGTINEDGISKFTLLWDDNGTERSWSTTEGENYKEALGRLEDFATAAGIEIKVKRIVIDFE